MNEINFHGLGTFEVVSGSLRITDPCYSPDTWCATRVKAKNGTWNAQIKTVRTDGWGTRVAELIAWHEDNGRIFKMAYDEVFDEIGVDSGQAGFFDADNYQNENVVEDTMFIRPDNITFDEDSRWYSLCCDRTLETKVSAAVIPFGVVSSSGYGDGGYVLLGEKNKDGEYDLLRLVFIEED